jgi:hypothetical protein
LRVPNFFISFVWKMEKEKSFKATKTLYVSDLDGTLFGADSRVSATSAAILNKAISAGVMFTPATARTPATVQPLLSRCTNHLQPVSIARVAAVCLLFERQRFHQRVSPRADERA